MELIEYDTEQPTEAFRIENDELASWALRKFAALTSQMKRNERLAKLELDRIATWLDRENAKLVHQAEFFEEHLKDYGRRERENRKTISLPYGKIKSRKTPERVEVDEAVFVPWAQENNRDDLLIFADPKPNKTLLKNAGEIPGVEVKEGHVSFYVEVSDED